eukprot:g45092.t1
MTNFPPQSQNSVRQQRHLLQFQPAGLEAFHILALSQKHFPFSPCRMATRVHVQPTGQPLSTVAHEQAGQSSTYAPGERPPSYCSYRYICMYVTCGACIGLALLIAILVLTSKETCYCNGEEVPCSAECLPLTSPPEPDCPCPPNGSQACNMSCQFFRCECSWQQCSCQGAENGLFPCSKPGQPEDCDNSAGPFVRCNRPTFNIERTNCSNITQDCSLCSQDSADLVNCSAENGLVVKNLNLVGCSMHIIKTVGVRAVCGDVLINNNPALTSVDLSSIECGVYGSLKIMDNPKLSAVNIPNLAISGGNLARSTLGVEISGNPLLKLLKLSSLWIAKNGVAITDLANLTSLDMGKLRTVYNTLDIEGHPKLPSVMLPSLWRVQGSMKIANNSQVESIEARLDSGERVRGNLIISDNTRVDLIALGFDSVGGNLTIERNGELRLLDLSRLALVAQNLQVRNNGANDVIETCDLSALRLAGSKDVQANC